MRETQTAPDTASVSEADHLSTTRAEKAQRAQLERQTEIDDLHWLMGDKRGRRFMWRLLTSSGIYRSSFNVEPLAMAFAEGQRNTGLKLVDEITRHCAHRFSEMQKEATKHEHRSESKGTPPARTRG